MLSDKVTDIPAGFGGGSSASALQNLWPNIRGNEAMGVRAALHEISSDEFAHMFSGSGKRPKIDEARLWSIDKAWYDYYPIFRDADAPLKYTISGDRLHPESSHSLDEFYEGNHNYYAGFVSPPVVRQIAHILSGIAPANLEQMYRDHGIEYHKYDWDMFEELKLAYVEAASTNCALMITIA